MATWTVDGKEDRRVDPADRGLAYGDGVFETMAAIDGAVRHFELHMERLETGCSRLGFAAPDRELIANELAAALPRTGRCVAKLIVTRGSGERGYDPPTASRPTRILGISSWPDIPAAHYREGIELETCRLRLGENPALAGLKHLARLEQVLARMELAERGATEGLLLDTKGRVVGGTMSNVFVVRGGAMCTPDLSRCGVCGVMRRLVLEIASRIGRRAEEVDLVSTELHAADEIFVTNAVFGIWPVRAYDGTLFEPGPVTRQLQSLLGDLDA